MTPRRNGPLSPQAVVAEPADSHSHGWRRHDLTLPSGHAYRLLVATPTSPPPPGGYPVLYLLDGNAAAASLSPELLAQWPDLVLVAVGYQTSRAFDTAARSRDYTPPLRGQAGAGPDPERAGRLVGGAQAFLGALVGPLRRQAEAGLPIDASRRTLWGHSYGALLTLYALFTAPDAFARYLPVSPSLWWGDGVMADLEQAAAARPGPAAEVLVMLGDMESRSGQPPLAAPRPAPLTLALIERLAARPDLAVSSQILAGAQHGPALRLSLPYALALAASH